MTSLWMEHALRLADEGHEVVPPRRTPIAPGKQTRTAAFPPRDAAAPDAGALDEIAALLRGLAAADDLPPARTGTIASTAAGAAVANDPFALHVPMPKVGHVAPEAPATMLARAAEADGAVGGGAIAERMGLRDVPVHRGDATRAALSELGVRGASAGDRVFAADDDPHVLAHELAHVAQGAGADAPGAEGEADRIADELTARRERRSRVPLRRAPMAAAVAFYGGTVSHDRVNLRSRADATERNPPQLARGTAIDIERTEGAYYYVRVLDGEHRGEHGYVATGMVTVTPQPAAQPGNTQPGNAPPGNAQPVAAPNVEADVGALLATDLNDRNARALGVYLDAHPTAAPVAARLVVEHLIARAGRAQVTSQIRARVRRVAATRPAFQSALETEVQGRVHSRAVEARELTEGNARGVAPGGQPGEVSIWRHYRRAVLCWAMWRVASDRVTADERQRQPPAEEGPMRRWALAADTDYRLERARWEALRARRDRDLREIEAISSLDDDAAEEHVELADHLTETNAREINRSATDRNHLNRLGPRIAADDRGEPAEGVAAEQELDQLRRDLDIARDTRDHLPAGEPPAERRQAQTQVRTAQRRLDNRTRQTQGARRDLQRYRAEHQRLADEHARTELATLTADRDAGLNEIITSLSWDGADATVWTPALRQRVWDLYLQHVPAGVNDGPAHQLVMETNIISVVADRQHVGGGRADMGFGTHHSVSTYSRHGSGQFDVNTEMNQRIWAVLPSEANFATVLDQAPVSSTGAGGAATAPAAPRTSFILQRIAGQSRVHHVISLSGSDAADADMMAKLLDGLMGRGHNMGDLRAWGHGSDPLAGVTARDVIGALYYENTQAQDNAAPGGGRRSTTSAVAERDAARAELERVALARLHALTPPAIPAGPGVPTPTPVISYAAIAGPLFVAQDLGAANAAHQDDTDRGHLTGDAGPTFRAGISPQAAVRDAAFDAALTPALAGFTGTPAQRNALVSRLRGAYRADVMRAAGGALNAHDPGLEGALRALVAQLDHNAPASRVHADRAGQMVTVTHRFHDAVTNRDFTVAVDYIHMSSVFVRAGTVIPEGAPFLIGRTGSSGNALTPHVHMGIAVFDGTTPSGSARDMPHLDPVSFFRTTP